MRLLSRGSCADSFLLLGVLLALAPAAAAQRNPSGSSSAANGGQVVVHVRDAGGGAFQGQALVRLTSATGGLTQMTVTRGTEYVIFPGLAPGSYVVEVTAPGYVASREEATLSIPRQVFDLYISIRPQISSANAPGAAQAPVLAPKASKELDEASQALLANDLAAAQEHLEKAQKLAPGHPDVHYLMGMLALRQKDQAKARSELAQATRLFPNHRLALNALGSLLYEAGEYAAASEVLERAVEADGDSWRTHWRLACSYYQQREYVRARLQVERALQIGKDDAGEAQLVLGLTLAALGERAGATQAFETFLRLNPNHAAAGEARQRLEALRAAH